jgi:hypothetical protein
MGIMRITTTAIAATFALLMLMAPGIASAEVCNLQPRTIQQVGYFQPVGYWHHRPAACLNRHFRHHHPYLCR